jgi:hypothetical protein
MSASSAAASSHRKQTENTASEKPIHETIVMFIERGKRTDKYGWLAAFDELAEYLGRMS